MDHAESKASDVLVAVQEGDFVRAEQETLVLQELLAAASPEEAARAGRLVREASTLAKANRAHTLYQLRMLARQSLYSSNAAPSRTFQMEG